MRRRLGIALAVLGCALVLLALAAIPAFRARTSLLRARDAMEKGRAALLSSDARSAESAFVDARSEFIRAHGDAGDPVLRLFGLIPILGRTPDVLLAVADAGESAAEAGLGIATAVADLPGGLASLAPHDGVLPTAPYPQLAAAFSRAASRMDGAVQTLRATNGSLLVSAVRDARQRALDQLTELDDKVRTAATILERMPDFLGVNGPRHYFVGAQNPAEARGTGGFIGSYTILTTDEGRLSFARFRTIQYLDRSTPKNVPSPNPSYADNWSRFGGPGLWDNINMTPDVPSAAMAIENAYQAAFGEHLDGVLLADPLALGAMLKVTGPVEAPSLGITLTPENFVPFVTNQVYSQFDNMPHREATRVRKAALGLAAGRVLERFVSGGPTDLQVFIEAISAPAAGGHIRFYANDPKMQQAFVGSGIGGAFSAPPGDFLSVVLNNAGANKVDFFLHRHVSYSVHLEPGGTSSGIAVVTLANQAPATGQPLEVIGPREGIAAAGENVAVLTTYCAQGCTAVRAVPVTGAGHYEGVELGLPYLQDAVRIASGEQAEIAYHTTTPGAWTGTEVGGTYRFTFANQPTINPTELHVEITVPEGMHVTGTTPGARVQGNTVVWDGIPDGEQQITVSFQASTPARIWHGITDFFSKPLVRL